MFAPPAAFSIPLAPAVPIRPETFTYTRFSSTFEPFEYTDWIDESMSWKTTCYVGDWSPLGKLRVRGPEALKFFSTITVNSFAKFDVGQAKHAVFCNDDGKVMGEGILMKLAEQDFLFTSGPGVLWAEYQFGQGRFDATMEAIGPQRFILQVQGPNALFVMEKLCGESLRDIGFMRFRTIGFAGCEMLALRQGMAGEVGFELHGPLEQGVAVYQAILDAGAEYGIRRLGGRTKMVNHVEACFPTPSVDYVPAMFGRREQGFHDFVQEKAPSFFNLVRHRGSYPVPDISALYRSPVELGWAKSIKFDHEFIGSSALRAELASPRRTMVTLVWNDDDVVDVYASLFRAGTPNDYMEMPRRLLGGMECDRVEHGGCLVGATSSRCYSYHFRKMLSLCVIEPHLAQPGTEVTVVYGGTQGPEKPVRAVVAQAPYKTDRRKIDLATLQPAVPTSLEHG